MWEYSVWNTTLINVGAKRHSFKRVIIELLIFAQHFNVSILSAATA